MWQTNWHTKQLRSICSIRIGDERGQCFNDTYQHTTEHRSNQVTNTSQHSCCKGNQAKLETNVEDCTTFLQAINETGSTCQCGTNEEGNRNDAVNVHTHECSGFTVLRNRSHSTSCSRACHHPL